MHQAANVVKTEHAGWGTCTSSATNMNTAVGKNRISSCTQSIVESARSASGSDSGRGSNGPAHDDMRLDSWAILWKVHIEVGSITDDQETAPEQLMHEEVLLPDADAAAERQCLK